MTKPDQRVIDGICGELVQAMRHVEAFRNDTSEDALRVRLVYQGEIHGLRKALCHLKGWDPATEADEYGAADKYVRDWHNRTFAREGAW
jgi:hypothetical protein